MCLKKAPNALVGHPSSSPSACARVLLPPPVRPDKHTMHGATRGEVGIWRESPKGVDRVWLRRMVALIQRSLDELRLRKKHLTSPARIPGRRCRDRQRNVSK